MKHDDFIEKSKQLVCDHINGNPSHAEGSKQPVTTNDVFIVWSVKVLQNSKALLSTSLPDGRYFESTLNGDRNEIYFDAYGKISNIKVEV